MSKYLGNNFWLLNDGKILNTKTQQLFNDRDLPFRMNDQKMCRTIPVEENTDFYNMKEGHRFVLFDYCEEIKRVKATTYVTFMKFKTIDQTKRKYSSIKENNGFFTFDYKFYPNKAYILDCIISHDFPDSVRILKHKQLLQNHGK